MAQHDQDSFIIITITGGILEPQIRIHTSTTIFALKEMVQGIFNMKIKRQTLHFQGQELQDDSLVKDCNLQPNSEVRLAVAPYNKEFIVQVKTAGGSVRFVRVKETMLVEEFKIIVGKEFGMLPESFTLFRFVKEMKDDTPLSAYFICKFSEVKLVMKIEPR